MCLYAQCPVLKRSQSSIPNYVIHSPVPKYQWDLLYTGIAAYTGIIDGIILISGLYTDIFGIPSLKGSQSNNSPSGVGTTALLNLRGAKYLQSMNISLNRHRY